MFASVQVNERGRPREERERQNGGLYEEEAATKEHRKPERTLRYTDTNNTTVRPDELLKSRERLLKKEKKNISNSSNV